MGTGSENTTDKLFLSHFQAHTLEGDLSHLGHMRLAWLYLNRFNIDEAASRFCRDTKSYAEGQGAYNKFHFTLTDALIRIMGKRTAAIADISWQEFQEKNTDIVKDYRKVLEIYFTSGQLMSARARQECIAPDKQAF